LHRVVLSSSALLVAALLVAPTGLAQRPDDRAGPIGVGSVTAPAQTSTSSPRPDDRAEPRGPGAISLAPAAIPIADDGFDWRDAGVGLAGGLGLALVAAGLLAAATHKQRMQHLA
jgi:hypothetical protein